MKILKSEITEIGLAQHACRASAMLRHKDFTCLVNRYGYAVANGRERVAAVQEDFERSLFGSAVPNYEMVSFIDSPTQDAELQIYAPNEMLMVASYSHVQVAQHSGRIVIFDLVVFGTTEDGYYVSVEDVYEHRFAA